MLRLLQKQVSFCLAKRKKFCYTKIDYVRFSDGKKIRRPHNENFF